MILVLLMVLKVMKSKSTLLVSITVTTTGPLKLLGELTILQPSEEVSRSGKEHAKVAMALCIKNTICLSKRVSTKESSWTR
jgi:hypothetical protein